MEPPVPDPGFVRQLKLIDPDLGAYFDFDREGWYIQKRRGREVTTLCLVSPDGLHSQLLREIRCAAATRGQPVSHMMGAKRRASEMKKYQLRKAARSVYREQAEREADVIGGRRLHAMGAAGSPAASPIVSITDAQRYADIIPRDAR